MTKNLPTIHDIEKFSGVNSSKKWKRLCSPYAKAEVELHTIGLCCTKMQVLLQTKGSASVIGIGTATHELPYIIISTTVWENIIHIIFAITTQMGLRIETELVYHQPKSIKVSWLRGRL